MTEDQTTNPIRLALEHLRDLGRVVHVDEFLPGVVAFRIDNGPELTPAQFLQAAWQ